MADDSIPALKRQLADAILALSDCMPVTVAARRLGIDAARMCDLRRGRIARFSVERLIRILATVDRGVELTVVLTGPERICWFPAIRARRQQSLQAMACKWRRESRAP
jgi:predicted XRE-type DNA-binding protein